MITRWHSRPAAGVDPSPGQFCRLRKARPISTPDGQEGPGLVVLVVDDNRDGADSMAEVARLHGHAARTAYTPVEALAVLDSFAPDAVLMDLGMPGMDGYTLAREICGRLGRRPLLVAVTGHTALARRSQDEGFDEHFLKPVDPAALMMYLAAHAAKRANGNG